jgi:hypothetical protein
MLGARVKKSKMHKDISKYQKAMLIMVQKKVKTASFYYYYCVLNINSHDHDALDSRA